MKQKFLLFLASVISFSLLNHQLTAQQIKSLAHYASTEKHPIDKIPNHSQVEEKHQHRIVEIPQGQPIPILNLVVHKDAIKGWNLELQISNFNFAPDKVNQESSYNQGHAHLYINGKKVTRLYSNWYYIADLEPGKNEIKVSLNTNKHEDLMVNGKILEKTVMIEIN